MDFQGTLNSQVQRGKKTGKLVLFDLKLPTKQQQAKQCGTGIRTDIQTSGLEQRNQKLALTSYGQQNFDKGAKAFNGERTVLSTNGARETGQPHAKEFGPLP